VVVLDRVGSLEEEEEVGLVVSLSLSELLLEPKMFFPVLFGGGAFGFVFFPGTALCDARGGGEGDATGDTEGDEPDEEDEEELKRACRCFSLAATRCATVTFASGGTAGFGGGSTDFSKGGTTAAAGRLAACAGVAAPFLGGSEGTAGIAALSSAGREDGGGAADGTEGTALTPLGFADGATDVNVVGRALPLASALLSPPQPISASHKKAFVPMSAHSRRCRYGFSSASSFTSSGHSGIRTPSSARASRRAST
jgi:hypothetical protein